jgi:hypothetical protein
MRVTPRIVIVGGAIRSTERSRRKARAMRPPASARCFMPPRDQRQLN